MKLSPKPKVNHDPFQTTQRHRDIRHRGYRRISGFYPFGFNSGLGMGELMEKIIEFIIRFFLSGILILTAVGIFAFLQMVVEKAWGKKANYIFTVIVFLSVLAYSVIGDMK